MARQQAQPQLNGDPGSTPPVEPSVMEAVNAELAAARTRHDEHEAQQPPRESTVAYKIAGRDFQLPQELVTALTEREKEFDRKLSENSNELGQLRQWRQQVSTALNPQPQPQPNDLATTWFTDPPKAAEQIENRTVQRIAQMYQAQQALQSFWSTFDRKYPDLADSTVLKQALFQQHYATLNQAKSIDDAADVLAEHVGKEVLRITRKTPKETNGTPPRLSERASGPRAAAAAPEDEEETQLDKTFGTTLSSALRAKAKLRAQKAAAGGRRSG